MFSQFLSIGSSLFLYSAFLILITPSEVNNCPFLAFLVGNTQSNISIPYLTASTISSGVPTPMRYLGLSLGNLSDINSNISFFSFFDSPTLKPPRAIPSKSISISLFKDISLKSLYIPPWTMPNNAESDL